jgi:hypothetical protein
VAVQVQSHGRRLVSEHPLDDLILGDAAVSGGRPARGRRSVVVTAAAARFTPRRIA